MSVADRMRRARIRRKMAGPRLLRAFSLVYEHPFFIEIGSNDGQEHDHLHLHVRESEWRGVMVEPVPHVFDRLQRNYADLSGLAMENVAIADRDGHLPFFHLAPAGEDERDGLPTWYDALGSFSRDVIASHSSHIPDIEERIVAVEVPTRTFESLCASHGVERLDLLVVDTEGYDYEILKTVDLDRHRPRLVVYEHYHLTPDDRARARHHLEASGYQLLEEGFDTWCLLPGRRDALDRAWRSARPAIPPAYAHE